MSYVVKMCLFLLYFTALSIIIVHFSNRCCERECLFSVVNVEDKCRGRMTMIFAFSLDGVRLFVMFR